MVTELKVVITIEVLNSFTSNISNIVYSRQEWGTFTHALPLVELVVIFQVAVCSLSCRREHLYKFWYWCNAIHIVAPNVLYGNIP
jgi:hypothetical protein